MSVYHLIHRLQNQEADYIAEQTKLDNTLVTKVLDALDQIADPTCVPTSIYAVGDSREKVEFNFGTFTTRVYDHHERAMVQVLAIKFEPGLIVRTGTATMSLLHHAIKDKLELDTRYGGPHNLKIDVHGEKLYIDIEIKVA